MEYVAEQVLDREQLDRMMSETDKIFSLVKGKRAVAVRDMPALFSARFGYGKTLHQIRMHVSLLKNDGLVVSVARGFVGDALIAEPIIFS